MKPSSLPLYGLTQRWRLSTKIVAALAIAMFPMGIFAVMLAMRSSEAFGDAPPTWVQLLSILMPVLMWIAALLTAWFAVHRLVVKPLVIVQRLMDTYGKSTDDERTGLRLGARRYGSNELASLAGSFDAMADEIDQHSSDLRGAIVEQQRLAREVHHRVKNNLQIVSSLLSLQARAADTPEIAKPYAAIQARITALSQVHRWMFDDKTNNGVNLEALVGDICQSLEVSLLSPEHQQIKIESKVEPVVVHADVAVPVAFLVTEFASLAAMNSAIGPLLIRITASSSNSLVSLAISSASFTGADQVAVTSMLPTARIIHGMARQLRSSIGHDAVTGRYSISFAPNPPEISR